MRYLVTTKDNAPFLTAWFDPENHFNPELDMVVYDLVKNVYTTDGHYFQDLQRMATHDLIRDTKERAKYILERIDAIEHLVKGFPDNPESILDIIPFTEEWSLYKQVSELKDRIKEMEFMIDNGLGWDDMRNDIGIPHKL